MISPRMMLYYGQEQHPDPSGGLLWVLLDQLSEAPGGGSLTVATAGTDDDVFLYVQRLPGGYRLMVQHPGIYAAPVVAYPVDFDIAYDCLLAWSFGHDNWQEACDWQLLPPRMEPEKPPALIRIAHEPNGSRTDLIGRYAGGQFLALIHGTRANDIGMIGVALILFDHSGNYVRSEIHNNVPLEDASTFREQLVSSLTDVACGDIAVKTFSVQAGDVTWCLVDHSEEAGAQGQHVPAGHHVRATMGRHLRYLTADDYCAGSGSPVTASQRQTSKPVLKRVARPSTSA